MAITPEQIQLVRAALESDRYEWRTLKGIAQETQLPLGIVQEAIQVMGATVAKSEVPSITGESLYTTTTRYHRNLPTDADIRKIFDAFSNKKYKWRTIKGISAETGLTASAIMSIIYTNKDKIIQSDVPSVDGEDLYTTRERYLEDASPLKKMLGFFNNRLT